MIKSTLSWSAKNHCPLELSGLPWKVRSHTPCQDVLCYQCYHIYARDLGRFDRLERVQLESSADRDVAFRCLSTPMVSFGLAEWLCPFT